MYHIYYIAYVIDSRILRTLMASVVCPWKLAKNFLAFLLLLLCLVRRGAGAR